MANGDLNMAVMLFYEAGAIPKNANLVEMYSYDSL